MSDELMSNLDNFDGTKVPEVVTPSPELMPSGDSTALTQETFDIVVQPEDYFGSPPLRQDIDPTWWESAEIGVMKFGITTGAAEYLLKEGAPPAYVDPEHNVFDLVNNNEVWKPVVAEAVSLAAQGDTGYQQLIEDLQKTTNSEQVAFQVRRMAAYKEKKRLYERAGTVPVMLGALAGVSLDVLASTLTLNPLGIGVAGANIAVQTARGARAVAAARVGAFGAVEGGLSEATQALTDPSIQLREIMLASGTGALVGGALGALAPKFFGEVVSLEDVQRHQREISEALDEMSGNLSAARVTDDTIVTETGQPLTSPTAIKGTGSLVVDKVIPKFIRSPKRRLADVIKQATKDRVKGLELNDRLSAVLSRMYKLTNLVSEDLQGQARAETMQEGLELVHGRMVVHEFKSQNIYDRFTTDVYGMGKLRRTLGNHELSSGITDKLGREWPTQHEFRNAADLYAQARGEGDAEGMQAALDKLRGRVPPEKMDAYEKAIREQADHDDEWFQKFGNAEVELEFISADDLKPGYRPQNWDTEYVTRHQGEFTNMVEELIAGTPDMDFVADSISSLAERRADDIVEGVEAPPVPKINEGEEWEVFAERMRTEDPEALRAIIEDWDEVKRAGVEEALDDVERRLRDELKKFGNAQVEEVLSAGDARMTGLQQRHTTSLGELERLKGLVSDPAISPGGRVPKHILDQIDSQATAIGRLEREMAAEKALLQTLRDLRRQQEELRFNAGSPRPGEAASLSRQYDDLQEQMRQAAAAGRKTSREVKDLQKQLREVERKRLRQRARARLRQTASDITNAIANNRTPGGFHVDDALESSRHFKRRALNLKGVRHQERWQRFLNTDSAMNMEIYTQAVSRQLEMRRKYLPFLRAEGYLDEGQDDVFQGLQRYLKEGLDNDLRTVGDTMTGDAAKKTRDRLEKEYADNLEFMTQAFGEFTRSDYLKHANENYDRVLSIAQSGTTAMALGLSLLASIADVAISGLAGTRVGTGIIDLLRPLHNSRILKQIAEDDELLAMYMRGARVMDNGMIVSRMDSDAPSLDTPGGFLGKIQRKTNSIAQLEMWTNLMHGWNRWVRGSFGVGFMRQISKDLARFDDLRPDLKGFYARHGIGAVEAKRMSELYSQYSRDVSGVRVPDLAAWARDGNDDLVERFYRAVNGAGNEALLDPGLGDRPFFRSNPLGRMILQFQSFTFAAGERWFAPLVQLGMMRPHDARVMWSSVMALVLAGTGQSVRDYVRGDESQLEKALRTGDTQDVYRLLTTAWMRSPYVTGMQGTAIDVIGTQLANPVNQAFQAVTGTQGEIINPEYVRLRQQQGIFALLGPAAGMANTGLGFARDIAEGDFEGARDTALARTPVANTLPLAILSRLVEQIQGD